MTSSEEITQRLAHLSYDDLSESQKDSTKSKNERSSYEHLSLKQKIFLHRGAIVLRGLLPSTLIENYSKKRETLSLNRSEKSNFWAGWHYPTPFMVHEELRDLALNQALMENLEQLVGEPMGLNLALTGWVSTQRNWHSDSYLNPQALGSRYVAVWMALDDIHPDSGPFQYVPGSHKWPVITQSKLFNHLTQEEQQSPHWPSTTENAISRMCEKEMNRKDARVEVFTPQKGDVLIWHSNLIHRGSQPKDPQLLRKSLICHYSGVQTRTQIDMPKVRLHSTGGHYFDLPTTGEVKP